MLRGPKNTFKTIFDLRRPCGPNEALRTPLGKNRVFLSGISDNCAYVCKYFLVGCATQKVPKGSKACAETVLNHISRDVKWDGPK